MPVDTSYCQFWHVNAIMLSEKDILEVKSVYLEKGARSIGGPKLFNPIDGYVRFHAKPPDLPV